MSNEVVVEQEAGVLTIRLNRPEVKNAVNLSMARAIEAAVQRLEADPDVRVGVLTGSDGVFCAGMDLKAFARGETPVLKGTGFAGIVQAKRRRPLIAAVEGHALAGGFEIALACDMIVAGRNAKFGLPEVKRGLIAAGGGLIRLPHRVPYHVAMEIALTGSFFTAERAYALGMVNKLTEDGEALRAALEQATCISENGPLAIVESKSLLDRSACAYEVDLFERQEPVAMRIMSSADAKEGAVAFAEKRKPLWSSM
ncbi:crotonase/enoyl-CoA hydratase family protein [Paraburkholderia sediminicola]|uniref:crotonase/enoyl-CoA hydratase family protein n=1 Tax=Paraburkholderia sediminicola TaxID=458836 RepID=UPI0038B99E2E